MESGLLQPPMQIKSNFLKSAGTFGAFGLSHGAPLICVPAFIVAVGQGRWEKGSLGSDQVALCLAAVPFHL